MGAFKQLEGIRKTFAYRIRIYASLEIGISHVKVDVYGDPHSELADKTVMLLKADRDYPKFNNFYFLEPSTLNLAKRASTRMRFRQPLEIVSLYLQKDARPGTTSLAAAPPVRNKQLVA